jgi:hypothetical protein
VYTEPRQLFDSVTDMPSSQVHVRHVLVLMADRRTDLVGRPLLYVHPTIIMTTRTKMLVGCIKMQLVSIKIMVHLCVGMLTLVTSLFVLRSK